MATKRGSFLILALIASVGCGGDEVVPAAPMGVARVIVTPASSSAPVGQMRVLTAAAVGVDGQPLTGRTITWTSSNTSVASLAPGGSGVTAAVTGQTTGTATITATCEGKSATATITVISGVNAVVVSPATASLYIGQTVTITATVAADSGVAQTVAWSTSNATLATVSTTGVVTAVAPGTAIITAQATADSTKAATARIVVAMVPVSTVTVTAPTSSVVVGATLQLAATLKDSAGGTLSAAGRAIAWSSSNTEVAAVSTTGLVVGVSTGNATMTALSEGKSATTAITVTAPSKVAFDYSRDLFGTGATVQANIQSVDVSTRTVVLNGVDTRAPAIPFTFGWGDGSVTSGFFPQSHIYADASRNYVARVTAHYSAGERDSVDIVARFVAPQIAATPFPVAVTVTIPKTAPALGTRQVGYVAPTNLQPFDDSFFGQSLPRGTLEYILSQAANVEVSVLENDIERVNGEWRQLVLRDPAFGGAYSIWYSTPIAFGAAAAFLQGTPGYSSLFHEMGHNLSLNAPASFRYGGRIDGSANAIFSEAVAQMFQHSVAFELVNNASTYGFPPDLALEIANSAHASARVIRVFYDAYIAQGKPFATWNDPLTPVDETAGGFMVVARQFMLHAEQAKSYIGPLTRAMRLLRTFNPSLAAQYAQQTNSPAANVFRSTLMVVAVSYGFQQDLRAEFRALNFPVDDSIYAALYASVP